MLQTLNGNKNIKYQKGLSVIEILAVIAIVGITLTSILSLATSSLKVSTSIKETIQANNFAQETMEAIRNFREGIDWNNDDLANQYDGLGVVSTGIAYHPEKSGDIPPRWMLVQGEESIGIFTRKIIFENVLRDTNDNIVESGGINDPDTKKVTVTVSWKNKKMEIISYLTNWK